MNDWDVGDQSTLKQINPIEGTISYLGERILNFRVGSPQAMSTGVSNVLLKTSLW